MCPTTPTLQTKSPPVTNLRSAFDILDVDNDGKISRDDLQSFYTGVLGVEASEEEDVIGSMITLADSNMSGYVEYDEFEKVVRTGSRTGNESREGGEGIMEEVFREMDKDGDGKVGVEDLKWYLGMVGMDVGDEEVLAMVRLGGGGGGNGGVSYQGFLKILEG